MSAVFYGCCDEFSEPLRACVERNADLRATLRTGAELPTSSATVPRADVAVVASYGRKLPAHVLDAYPLGVVNCHPSLLPRYRGAAPAEWQILRGERHGGVTLIRVNARMDAGHVLAATPFALDEHSTRLSLLREAAERGSVLLAALLADDALLRAAGTAQCDAAATQAPKVHRDLARVDWNTWDVQQFSRHFRALAERFDGLTVAPSVKVTQVGAPVLGVVDPARRFNKRLNYVAAQLRDGWVPLQRFVVASSAPMDARDLWNGYRSLALTMGRQ